MRARLAAVLATVALGSGFAGPVPSVAGGAASLAVSGNGAWHVFWRADQAPARWAGPDPSLTAALRWRKLAEGAEWASVRLACEAPVWRARLIVARLDPRRVSLSLRMDLSRDDVRPAWSIDRAPDDAILAVNAGQFVSTMPWGWVAIDGHERLRPEYGPLSSAVAIDMAGRVRWFHGDSLLDASDVAAGFQSYPTLLAGDGRVPRALRAPGRGVNLHHHDRGSQSAKPVTGACSS